MRGLTWQLPHFAFRTRHQHDHEHEHEHLNWVAPECRDEDEDTELAFHRVWLARELHRLPQPRPRPVLLPRQAAFGVDAAVHDLRRSIDPTS